MFFKKHIKKTIFLSIMLILFIIFALSNTSKVTVEIFHIKEQFRLWVLVLYSMLLGSIATILFIISPIINLKSKHKELIKKFEILSNTKLSEMKEIETDRIE